MEITKEIKIKVFGQYLGNKINFPFLKKDNIHTLCSTKLSLFEVDTYGTTNGKLILKPLISITHEDSIELAKIEGFLGKDRTVYRQDNIVIISDGLCEIRIEKYYNNNPFRLVKNGSQVCFENLLQIYQYLQSKGYDLPQYLLSGRTLKEAGLAIYD